MEKQSVDKEFALEPLIIALIGLLIAGLIVVWIGVKIRQIFRKLFKLKKEVVYMQNLFDAVRASS